MSRLRDAERRSHLEALIAECRRRRETITRNVTKLRAECAKRNLDEMTTERYVTDYLQGKSEEDWVLLYDLREREARAELEALTPLSVQNLKADRKMIIAATAIVFTFSMILALVFLPGPISVLTGNAIGLSSGDTAAAIAAAAMQARATGGTYRLTIAHNVFGDDVATSPVSGSRSLDGADASGEESLQLLVTPALTLSSYGTPVVLLEDSATPLGRHVGYRVRNTKAIDESYLAASPGVALTVTDAYGARVALHPLGETTDFLHDWDASSETTLLASLRKKLASAGAVTDPATIFPPGGAPQTGERLLLYAYPQSSGSWVTVTADAPAGPGRVIFLDPAGSWWNDSWAYHSPITVNSTYGSALTDERVLLSLNASSVGSHFNWSDNSSIRFTYYNATSGSETAIPYWIDSWNAAAQTASIWVKAPYLPASGSSTLYLYYGNPSAVSASNYTALWGSATLQASYNATLGAPECSNETGTCKAATSLLVCSGNQRAPGPEPNQPNTIDTCADGTRTAQTTCHSDESVENITVRSLNGTAIKKGDTVEIVMTAYCYGTSDDVGIFFTNDTQTPSWTQILPSTTCPAAGYQTFGVNMTMEATGTVAVRGVIDWNTQVNTPCSGNRYVDNDDLVFRVVETHQYNTTFGEEVNSGYLNTTITAPPNSTITYRGSPFTMNGTVTCGRGDCGTVTAMLDYYSLTTVLQSWTEDDAADFSSYNDSQNISRASFLALGANTTREPWWNIAWGERGFFNLTNNDGNLSDYYMPVTLNASVVDPSFNWSRENESIRFVLYNGTWTLLDQRITQWNATSQHATVWLHLSSLPSGSDLLHYYYNNSGAVMKNDSLWLESETAQYDAALGAPHCTSYAAACVAPSALLQCAGNQDTPEQNQPNTIDACSDASTTGTCHSDENVENLTVRGLNGTMIKAGDTINITMTVYCWGTQDRVGIFYTNDTTTPNWIQLTPQSQACTVRGGFESFSVATTVHNSGKQAVRAIISYNNDITSSCPTVSYTDIDDLAFTVLPKNDTLLVSNGSEQLHFLSHGTYISNAYETGASTQFEKIFWNAVTPVGTSVRVFTRSSADNLSWSPWFEEVNNTPLDAPDNSFVQYKALLETNNENVTPRFTQNTIQYRIATNGWTPIGADELFTGTSNHSCGTLTAPATCNASWSVTPTTVGSYLFKVATNTTASSFEEENMTILVHAKSNLLSFSENPSIVLPNETVTLKVTLLDDLSQPISNALVTFFDTTNKTILGTNTTNTEGVAMLTYTIPDSFLLGTHTIVSSYDGNASDFIEPAQNATTTFKVSSKPVISDQNATPTVVGIAEQVTISANVTDAVGVNTVWATITYPDQHVINLTLTKNGDRYARVFNDTWRTGTYLFKLWANNTDGVLSDPGGNFTVNASGAMYADPERDEYKNYETVHLADRRREDWWNDSWRYRSLITISGVNEPLTEYQVPLTLNTASLISAGKLNGNCSDLRVISTTHVYQLPVTVTNDRSEPLNNQAVKVTLTDSTILSHLSSDGSDLRVFTTTTTTSDPYAHQSDVPFWFMEKSGTSATVWVRLSLAAGANTTLYFYYGKSGVASESNYTSVFTTPIGVAGKTSATGSFSTTSLPFALNETPIVVGSLTSVNDTAQAALRLANVTTSNFSAKAEESASLDGVHARESIGYLALKPGTWILGGSEVSVGTATFDNPTGTTYTTVSYTTSFSSTPEVFAQVQTFNESDPVHIRARNGGASSIELKLEESTDTAHAAEVTGYLALPAGTYETGTGMLQAGHLSTTNAAATIPYGSSFSDPVLSSKIETENGGDNSHERLDGTAATTWVEEEASFDGAHTTETMSWLAATPGTLYGAPSAQNPTVVVGSETTLSSTETPVDFYLEECNSSNASVLVQVPFIPADQNVTLYLYYGNPSAANASNLTATLTYDSPETIGYVVNSNIGTLDVYSLVDGNRVSVGSSSATLDAHDTLSATVSPGTPVKVTRQVQADSAADHTDVISPVSWAGREFLYAFHRGTNRIDVVSPWGSANVTLYDKNVSVWNGIVTSSGTTITVDITDGNVARLVSDIPVLAQHWSTSGDAFPLYPATGDPLYGVPSTWLTIAAGPDGATVSRNQSSGGALTDILLASNTSFESGGFSADAAGPAYRLDAHGDPIGAIQQADSDGYESTTFLPERQLGTLFGSTRGADYIIVAARTLGTNCTVYDNTDSVVGSGTSTGTSLISRIGFGTGNDNLYVSGGWLMECDAPVWAMFDEASRDDETQLLTLRDLRQYHYPEPTATLENGSEEQVFTGLHNKGTTNITGYLYLRVESNASGTWSIVGAPVYQDITPRTLAPGEILNNSYWWEYGGAWQTGTYTPGTYRVYAAFLDNESQVIIDSDGNALEDTGVFTIVPALLQLNNLTHENRYVVGLDEYEAGDLLDWVNVTIKAVNNTAINAEINLTLLNGSGSYAGWGPNSVKSCGDVAEGGTCTRQWNNNSAGYPIPLSIPSGSYTLFWNVNMTSANGPAEENNSFTMRVHNTPSTFSSALSPTRIFTGGSPARYNFTFTNLWSVNLTNITVRLNLPAGKGVNASCIGGGTPSAPGVCSLAQLANGTTTTFSFNISAESSAVQGDYEVNVTLNYSNSRENRSWRNVEPQLLEVRQEGIIAITVTNNPANVTRGSAVEQVINAYVNNTAATASSNVTVNYTLPSSWTNTSPLDAFFATLAPNETRWHNLTFLVGQGASLGPQQVLLESGSSSGQQDFKYVDITVWANTSLLDFVVNDTNASRGEYVRFNATLRYDDGSPVSGATLTFRDVTDNVTIGSAVTGSGGRATRTYLVPENATVGLHTINVSYDGSSTLFTLSSWNTTLLDVGRKPVINALWASPNPQGAGSNVTLSANVTDDDAIDTVLVSIVAPNGTTLRDRVAMTQSGSGSSGVYTYLFNETWKNGTYSFTVWANDTTGSTVESSSTFTIENEAFLFLNVTQQVYGQNENVTISGNSAGWWFHPDWHYRQSLVFTNLEHENFTDAQVNFTFDTASLISAGKLNGNCSDLRFFSEDGASLAPSITNCNDTATTIWLSLPSLPALGNTTIFVYYGNPSAASVNTTLNESFWHGRQYVVSDTLATSNLIVAGMENGTTFCVDGSCQQVNQSQVVTINAANITATTMLNASLPVSTAYSYAGVGSHTVPLAFHLTNVTFPAPRGTQSIDILAPFNNASVTLYDENDNVYATITIPRGSHGEINYNAPDGSALRLTANTTVVVHYEDEAGNNDFMPLPPGARELYGVPQSASVSYVACAEDNTNVTIYESDGTVTSSICNRASPVALPAGSSGGQGPGMHLVANGSIVAFAVADGDGTEAIPFLPPSFLDSFYALPQDAEYITIVPVQPGTTCELRGPTGTLISSDTSTSYNPPRPQAVIRWTGTPISAGSRITCDADVWAYFESYSQNAETILLGPKSWRNAGAYTTRSVGTETTYGSLLSNIGNVTLLGELRLLVQRNVSGTWTTYATVLDDTATENIRTIQPREAIDLGVLWNASPWNTGNSPAGEYRAYAELLAPDGRPIYAAAGPIWNASRFNISQAPLSLNLTAITVYDVTDTLNKHIYTGNLTANGTNTTFNLVSDKVYRVEFHVRNDAATAQWNLSQDAVTHAGLNGSWFVNASADIWYRNASDGSDRLGGTWDGNVSWNVSGNGGLAAPGTSVTFSYIVNLSGAAAAEVPVLFTANDPLFLLQDHSVFKVLIPDTTPPSIVDSIYNLTNSSFLRGNQTTLYGRWNKTIQNATAEYNSTSSTLQNYSVTLPDPNTENWTNYTIVTTSLWTLGVHSAKLYASDLLGNWNTTLPQLNFTVWGLARVTSSTLSNNTISLGGSTTMVCTVKDATDFNPITGYSVSFYNETGLLGTNVTDANGNATWTYTDQTPGIENLTCNVTANATRYYQTDDQDAATLQLTTTENIAPYATNVTANATVAHKGDTLLFSALWHDNFQLDSALLSVNSSGSWTNVSNLSLSGSEAWANFSYTIPNNFSPGTLGWQQWGNDTSGNTNSTPVQSVEVWGWALIGNISLNPAFMYVGNTTIVTCRVTDLANGSALAGYSVSFYNETGLLGTNTTNTSGYATYGYTDMTPGVETLTCNITDDAARMYNASSPAGLAADLTTSTGGDIQPPRIIGENYGLNTTTVKKGRSLLIYGWWDEMINSSIVRYNSTSSTVNTYNVSPPYTGNWTNDTIVTNASWLVGSHVAKLEATDMSNNTNSTLAYLWFNVTATSQIFWANPPSGDVKPGAVNLSCRVTEEENGLGIEGYTVYFYNSTGDLIGTPTTNGTGYASIAVDASSYSGNHSYSCRIFSAPTMFYYIGSNYQASASFFFDGGAPSVTLLSPPDGNITSQTILNLSFRATDNRDGNMSCNVTLDNVPYTSTWALNNTQRDIQGSFGYGLHSWNVTCADNVGNAATSETWSFNVTALDTTPPTVTLLSPADGAFLNSSSAVLSYNATDGNALQNCSLYLDGVLNQTDPSPTSGGDSFTASGLSESSHSWSVLCYDTSLNAGTSVTRSFTVDLTPPSAFDLLAPGDGTISINTTSTMSWQQPVEQNFWNYTLQVSQSPLFLPALTTEYVTFNQSATSRQSLPLMMDATYYWRVIAADKAGNTRMSAETFTYITDNSPPTVLLVTPPDGDNDPDGNVTLTYEAQDNAITNCTLYTNLTGSWQANQTNVSVQPWQHDAFDLTGLPTGLNLTFHWNVLCFDSIGNAGWAAANRSVRIGFFNETQGNQTLPSNVTVNNTLPVTLSVSVSSPIDLIANGQQTVSCDANVSDDNGAADILGASAVFYRSDVTAGSPDNGSNHYTNASCGSCTPVNDTVAACSCTFSLWYYALPGMWTCSLNGSDANGTGTAASNTTTVNQLQALDVRPTLLDYGDLQGGLVSPDNNVSVINLGNVPIDVSLWGYAVSPSDGLAMSCLNGANITVSAERFSTAQGTAYGSMTPLTSTAPSTATMSIPVRSGGGPNATQPLYWKIQSGSGALGECNGMIIFQAEIA